MTSYVQPLASYMMVQFDTRVANQETREQFYKKVVMFSRGQPFIASFLAIQLLFGILPVLGLLGFALGVVGLALGFCAFWIGFGLCVMFSILTATATVATCVWISGVASLFCLKRILALLSGATSSSAPAKTTRKERIGEEKKPAENVAPAVKGQGTEGHNQKDNTTRNGETGDSPVTIEYTEINEKAYEEDTEGSDDTAGSYNRVKSEDLKYAQPNASVQFSEAEKMRIDIERSLQ